MMIQKSLKGLERMEVLIISHLKVFLGNKYNSYIHTTCNATVTSNRNVCEETAMKRKKRIVFRGAFRTYSNIYDEFLKKIINWVT